MGNPSALVRLLAVCAAACAAGCENREPPSPAPGLPMLQSAGSRGHEVVLDFGAVLVNSVLTRTVSLQNLGINDLVAEPPQLSGDGASAYGVELEGSVTLARLEKRTLRVRFSPVAGGDYPSDLRFPIRNGHPTVVTVHLRGKGIALACGPTPRALDFGRVPVGTEREMVARIANPTAEPWRVRLGEVVGEGFSMRGLEPGEQVIPPRTLSGDGELLVRVVFAPRFYAPYAGVLQLPMPAECGSEVPLRGLGVEQVLFCDTHLDATDASCGVDFGATNPGRTLAKSALFRNTSAVDIYLTYTAISQSSDIGKPFSTVDGARLFRIPAGGAPTEVALEYKPSKPGMVQTASMQFTTTDRKNPQVTVALRARSGGPWAFATPAAVDFDEVAIQTFRKRAVVVSNIGKPIPGGDQARLRFVERSADGFVGRPPQIIDSDQFTVDTPAPVGTGLAPGQSLTLEVHFAPRRVGPLSATLRVFSNDPEQPFVDVALAGLGVPLPTCDFEVTPNPLVFGYVEDGHFKDLTLAVVNRSPNPALECLVGDVVLRPNAQGSAGFSLRATVAPSIRLPGGAALELPIRFYMEPPAHYRPATLEFYVSNPATTYVSVPVTAAPTSRPALTVAPRALAFGVVAAGCSSRERRVTLANDGVSRVTLASAAIERVGANVFRLSDVPAFPLALAPDSTASVGITYHPMQTGEHVGELVVKLVGDTTPFVVPLSGRALLRGEQEDAFVQPDALPLDWLVVVDNGPTMASQAAKLARALGDLAGHGSLQRFDLQLGITTAAVAGGADANGRLLPLDADLSHPRVLTPGLPQLQDLIAQYLAMSFDGANPKPLAAALLALTPPASLNENITLFRTEADLAIVLVSDAADSDTAPIANYLHLFLAMKEQQRERLSISAIVPTQTPAPAADSGCTYASPNAAASTRYRDAAGATSGVLAEVCDASWTPALARALDQIYVRRRGFVLRGRPASLSGVHVLVDGAEVPQLSAHGTPHWTFDAPSNAVVFAPSAAPDPGTDVVVRYTVACL